MTLLDRPGSATYARPVPKRAPGRLRTWARDLGLGVRFAAAGGREGWIRTLLTAVGVGLGVTLLFFAASVPQLIDARAEREGARAVAEVADGAPVPRSDTTLVWINAGTEYRGSTVGGQLLRPDGARPPLPPGVAKVPGPGEMVVSPALRTLLDSPGGALLKERLGHRVTGTIAGAGLLDPEELRFYAGSDTLTTAKGGHRTAGYGSVVRPSPISPYLIVLIVLISVVLLMPVVIFIATAVRFGGDRRDRRLAALRLVGADIAMTRRIAAGEALFGAALGLLAGFGLFLALRPLTGGVRLWNLSAFPADLVPAPQLVALIVTAVPVAAVVVTLVALRSVTIEPLGVVREARPRRRRLWWRLLMPVVGVTVLSTVGTVGEGTAVDPYPIAAGAVLVLVGLTTLLPWLVEAVVAGLTGGPVPWQLAARRLQLSGGSASRAVIGITAAVAGAIAVQMMFAGMHEEFVRPTGQDPTRANITVQASYGSGRLAQEMTDGFRGTKGVTAAVAVAESYVVRPGPVAPHEIQPTTILTVGTCATLRELAELPSCADGDAFVSHIPGRKEQNDWVDETARPGKPVDLGTRTANGVRAPSLWTLPASARTVEARTDPVGRKNHGILATPGALDPSRVPDALTIATIRIDERVADAEEYVRNTAAALDPTMRVITPKAVERDRRYASVQTGLLAGGTATMALIAASVLVSQIEQLRERRRLLSVLVAVGTRRSTLAWSVLWQTAIPVALGTLLAIAGGLTLGAVLLDMVAKPVADWWVFAPFAGAGIAVILLVTVASLPPLWRMMRPDGLRSE
ncbi:FtsX-like permease family protein [Streptomyces scopuliridis]|uniref:Membrane protein n=1 Tax=Streptomyces scopuliridis RB72 TaxID=1440053 RepID=A0A2T7TAF4_9ACTN|nr:FtsX-like permease family protein [Streptomyces scopuliridis]PVE12066.1 membrane protein [Streptomyces scopuliridis RB72]